MTLGRWILAAGIASATLTAVRAPQEAPVPGRQEVRELENEIERLRNLLLEREGKQTRAIV